MYARVSGLRRPIGDTKNDEQDIAGGALSVRRHTGG